MLFPTFEFAAFFGIVLPLAWWLSAWLPAWRWTLLLASLVFYSAWDPRFLPLLLLLGGCNHVLAHRAHDRGSSAPVTLAVVTNLLVLVAFKYPGFLASSANAMSSAVGLSVRLPLVQPPLPPGLSFVVFQAISYVVDVGRRNLAPCSLRELLLYFTFFPHVIAGPIVRASEFLPQVMTAPSRQRIEAGRALSMVVRGLFKKVVLATQVAAVSDEVFSDPSRFAGSEVLVGVYAYAVQIYCDFSGYTDMAIGCALLLGIQFPENFDSPYRAGSLQDFWRRWHITLSRWLRDFLYIPLGGNRGGPLQTYRNLLLTMVIGGLWHGANWTFVAWGALHGLGLAFERRFVPEPGPGPHSTLARVVRVVVTFHFVCLCWVVFRADSWQSARDVLRGLARPWHLPRVLSPALVLAMAAAMLGQWIPRSWELALERRVAGLRPIPLGLTFGLCLALIEVLGPPGIAPFIYFRF